MTSTLLDHRAEGPETAPPSLGPSLGTSYALRARSRPSCPGHPPGGSLGICRDTEGSAPDLIGPGASVGDLAALVLGLADSLRVAASPPTPASRSAARSVCTSPSTTRSV